jgi:long-chain acyl-CoA synthetase
MPTSTERSRAQIGRIALGDVIHRSARRFGSRTALIDGERRISFTELNALSNCFAHYLLAQGLQSGDMVAVFLGIQKAGMVWVPMNTSLSSDAIRYIFEHAEIRHVVIDAEFFRRPDMGALLRELAILPVICVRMGELAPEEWQTFDRVVDGQTTTLPDVVIEDGQLAQIMYTSGTTGRQKGVMHSHASVNSVLMSNLIEWGSGMGADVYSCMLPMFHVGQHTVTMTGLLGGSTMVIMQGFNAEILLDAIERHRITVLVGLPMMYAALLDHPMRPGRNLSSLRFCIYAMAPMSKTLLLRLLEEFCPSFALCSGQTEMYTAATIFEPHQQLQRFGAYWGVATFVNEIAIMAEDGTLLEPMHTGEVVYRGPNVMLGYYKDPEATAATQKFGWHHSGDLGMFDEDGQLLFLDRIKDMVKTGGENVPSIKIEEVLLRHPSVSSAAVVGLPHQRWGEAITAFVTLKPTTELSNEELERHCRQHLGGFEIPKSFILLENLPVTSTGKLQKFSLRQQYLDHYTD